MRLQQLLIIFYSKQISQDILFSSRSAGNKLNRFWNNIIFAAIPRFAHQTENIERIRFGNCYGTNTKLAKPSILRQRLPAIVLLPAPMAVERKGPCDTVQSVKPSEFHHQFNSQSDSIRIVARDPLSVA